MKDSTSLQSTELTDRQQEFAEQVLRVEGEAILSLVLDTSFHQAVQLILDATGSDQTGTVVVSGLGKSGLIGKKLSATFSSTGTPSHWLHPVEAMHGDLGRVRRGDVAIMLSASGGTAEVVALATVLRQDDVPVIGIVASRASDLARLATVALCIGDVTEACPLDLSPTTSATSMLVLGDALALTVCYRRGFGLEDFRKVHPGGALGRQLMPVVSAMRFRAGENVALVAKGLSVSEALREAKQLGGRRTGAFLIVDDAKVLVGIYTDSDLRRLVVDARNIDTALSQPIEQVMTGNPHFLTADALVRDAVQMAREFRIDEIPVVDAGGRPLGLIDVQDLVAPKVVESQE